MPMSNAKEVCGDGSTLYRECRINLATARRQDEGEDRLSLTLSVSSEEPVDRFGIDEILQHSPESVRLDRLRSIGTMLVNHREDSRAGRIDEAVIEDGRLVVTMTFGTSDAAQQFQKEVEDGTLRGVSIGYRVFVWRVDEESNTMTAIDWEPMEASFVSVPADATVGVGRSDEMSREAWNLLRSAATTMNKRKGKAVELEQLLRAFPGHDDLVTRLHGEGKDLVEIVAAVRKAEEAERSAEQDPPNNEPDDESERAAKIREEREANERFRQIVIIAESHGLRASDYSECESLEVAVKRMMKDKAERAGSPEVYGIPGNQSQGVAYVGAEAQEKFRDAGVACMLRSIGFDLGGHDGRKFLEEHGVEMNADVIRARDLNASNFVMQCALREVGHAAAGWDKIRLASWAQSRAVYDPGALVRTSGFHQRSPAQQTTGQFASILANTADLAMLNGFNRANITYPLWCVVDERNDFKQATIAALASGRLDEVLENEAFPEMVQEDGGYNTTLAMFGRTVSWSFQALVNDELGEVTRQFQRVGQIAGSTIERESFSKLLNATWTNDTDSSVGLSTPSNLDTVRAALAEKLDPAGEPMRIVPRFLLVDVANSRDAQVATGEINSPGQTAAIAKENRGIETISSVYVGDTGLLAGVATTDYYLTGDPGMVDTVRVSFLAGVRSPMVVPFDPGAVAANKWKIMLPFVSTVATHTDSAGNARVTGIHRGKA